MFCHADADAFFAAVLVRKDHTLRGKPLLALGMGGGCVISASYEAKARGVKTGMTLKDALALVPDAIHIPSDFQETGLASSQIESVLLDTCPVFEQYSIDEWFLDLTTVQGGVPKDLLQFAHNLRKNVLEVTAISMSVGIGSSKLLSKMASEYRKPAGVTVVEPNRDAIRAFLSDRPAEAIPGIGRRRSVHAQVYDWKTAWDIATAPTNLITKLFGKPGKDMQTELLGTPLFDVVEDPAPPKSVSRARSFPPLRDMDLLWAHLRRHLEYIVLKMRRHDLACQGISVWLRDHQYHHASSHHPLPKLLNTEQDIQPYALSCFKRLYQRNQAYTQIGMALWRLHPQAAIQFSLFEKPEETLKEQTLQKSLDALHGRFGRDAITHGASLGIKSGWKKHLDIPIYE